MPTKRLVLHFPPNLIDQPVTYLLITKYNLRVNILRARITEREWGRLVMELSGSRDDLESGLKFLDELGVEVKPLAQNVLWHEDRCIECTACTSICPTGALATERPGMEVVFREDKCIACELCIPVCPYRAVEIMF